MSKAKSKTQEEFNPSEKIIAIQSAICGLKKDAKNPFHKSKYMNLSTIVNALKPILYENDCYSSHELGLGENDKPFLESKICYKDGTKILSCKSPLPVKDSNDPQKLGSAITYMRRYNLTALLEIEEDDDDGNGASNNQNSHQKLGNIAAGVKGEMNQLKNIKKSNDDDKKEKAQSYFQKLKKDIEACGSIEEIDGILEEQSSAIYKLQNGYKTIYNLLMDCVSSMKGMLDPGDLEANND